MRKYWNSKNETIRRLFERNESDCVSPCQIGGKSEMKVSLRLDKLKNKL